jgi:histidine ammonia-lyase
MNLHAIGAGRLTLAEVGEIMESGAQLQLSADALERITRCRNYLDDLDLRDGPPVYGVNTGFGALHDRIIPPGELTTLQENLVKSHACGMGDQVPAEIVRLMLFLKIQSLSYGNSGVHPNTVNRLIYFFNNDILPVVYEMGSLGASGDLAPLAHLSLPLIGEGEVMHHGVRKPAMQVLRESGLEPVKLHSKAGLALLNGTQFMSAYGVTCCLRAGRLLRIADITGALSLDAFDGRLEPFHPRIHRIRPHKGQAETARRILNILGGSELASREKVHVQDPYSFRCIPQVHGASKDLASYVASVFSEEINSVTDNPTIFPDEDLVISAGNFHGQPLALALDCLAIALAELGNISERRTFQLISGKRGLPPFLVKNPGLNSGFMIPQYTAASMVSQNKQLCTPASVDSIESSPGQEDHVSMGANAALKAYKVLLNAERILAIEFFNAAQALDFRRPSKTSPFLEEIIAAYRERVGFIDTDQIMYRPMEETLAFLSGMDVSIPLEDGTGAI